MATLYKITKSLADVFKNSYVPIKDSDGNVTTDIIICHLSRKNVTNGTLSVKWSKRMAGKQLTDRKRMLQPFKTVLSTLGTATEKFQTDAINVQTAPEKFQTVDASHSNG